MPQPVLSNTALINLPNAGPGDGTLVYVVASVQSAATESVSITDSNGNVVFSASGASSSAGLFTVLQPTTSSTFNTGGGDGTFTVTLTTGCAYMQSENTISLNGNYFLQQYTFITNDGGWPVGADFNDLCVTITSFGYSG